MKTILKYFAAALAIVAAASCAKENATVENDERPDVDLPIREVTFGASILNTKTTLSGLDVHWSQDDKILVFPYTNGTTVDKHSPYGGTEISIDNESINDDFAIFTGAAYVSDSYAAIYPSGLVVKGSGYANRWGFVNNTLQTQTAVAGDFPKAHDLPAHISVATDGDGSTIFQFANALAYFKFQVSDNNIFSINVSADQVSKASGDGSDRALSSGANLGGTLYFRPGTGKYDIITDSDITISNGGAAFTTGTDYYIALPPVDMTGLCIVGKDESGNEIFKYQKSAFTAESNTIYNLGTIEQNIFAPKVYKIVSPVAKAEDLVSGKLYVIQSYGAKSYFWTNVNNVLVLTGDLSISGDFSAEHVFEYTQEGLSNITDTNYKSTSCGSWKSIVNEKYVSTSFNINAGRYTGMSVVSANRWGSDETNDIDIYKNSNEDLTIYYKSDYNLYLGTISVTGGNGYRKWYIYEVKEN